MLDSVRADFDLAGVELEMGPLELDGARGVGTGVYIRDPDGNRVELRYYA